MNRRTILVIEDDEAIRAGVVDALRYVGFEVLEAADGPSGLERALEAECDLLLLDLVLPGKDGLEILRAVRKERPTLPVIILTARGGGKDRVKGLHMGADDYVVKPFNVEELMARVEAVLRRSPERPDAIDHVDVPGGRADLARREVRFDDGERWELTAMEAALLRYLASNPSRVITREEILTRVWRLNPRGVSTRTIDMHVARLREKLRDPTDEPAIIITVRGSGYMFGTPVQG